MPIDGFNDSAATRRLAVSSDADFDRGVGRLMIVGGGNIHTQFLTAESTPPPPRVFIQTAGRARIGKSTL